MWNIILRILMWIDLVCLYFLINYVRAALFLINFDLVYYIYWCSHALFQFWLLIPSWPPFAVGMSRSHSLFFSWALGLQQWLICSSMFWVPSCLCLQLLLLVLHKLYPQLFYFIFSLPLYPPQQKQKQKKTCFHVKRDFFPKIEVIFHLVYWNFSSFNFLCVLLVIFRIKIPFCIWLTEILAVWFSCVLLAILGVKRLFFCLAHWIFQQFDFLVSFRSLLPAQLSLVISIKLTTFLPLIDWLFFGIKWVFFIWLTEIFSSLIFLCPFGNFWGQKAIFSLAYWIF